MIIIALKRIVVIKDVSVHINTSLFSYLGDAGCHNNANVNWIEMARFIKWSAFSRKLSFKLVY
jgi:hypothetical protein